MDTLVKADIFFFIASIATIIFVILISICLYYLAGALRNFRDISLILKKGIENTSEHLEELVEQVEESSVFRFIFGKKKRVRK